MVGARRIRSQKPREGYARSLEAKRVDEDRDNVDHMSEQVKRGMVDSAREVRFWLSKSEEKEPKECVWLNDEVKIS